MASSAFAWVSVCYKGTATNLLQKLCQVTTYQVEFKHLFFLSEFPSVSATIFSCYFSIA